MRLRLGVAMPERGGRPAVVAAEVLEAPPGPKGRPRYRYVVGHVERVQPPTIEAAAERVLALTRATEADRPCVIIDVGTAQGLALRQHLRDWTGPLHRPHAYLGTRSHSELFANFLEAYADGRVEVAAGVPHAAELEKALVHYGGARGQKDVELSSEDEALVVALCLALFWPRHGPAPSNARAAGPGGLETRA